MSNPVHILSHPGFPELCRTRLPAQSAADMSPVTQIGKGGRQRIDCYCFRRAGGAGTDQTVRAGDR